MCLYFLLQLLYNDKIPQNMSDHKEEVIVWQLNYFKENRNPILVHLICEI